MKAYTFAAIATVSMMATVSQAQECDMMCMMIYSFNPETCSCDLISWMECHPQYNPDKDCNQMKEDEARGRNPYDNPYAKEEWYQLSVEKASEDLDKAG